MKTFPSGLTISKFVLWIITHVLFVFLIQPICGYHAGEREVVRGLCQAQCVALGYFLKIGLQNQCLGLQSVIPQQTDWLVDCKDDGAGRDFIECVGTCSLFRPKAAGYVPAKPEISVFLDTSSKNITLEWQPDTKVTPGTVYVISKLEPFNTRNQWKQIDIVQGGYFTMGPVDDICVLPSFRVAAVNRFGSRWFNNETKVPANIPGRPRNIQVKSREYSKNPEGMLFTLQWSPPSGWDIEDIQPDHNVSTTVQCSTENWEKVYVIIHRITRQGEDHFFTLHGRVSLNAIGCTIIFQISAISRCNSRLVGPPEKFRLSVKCTDLNEYKGEYCSLPPVHVPGPVSQLKLTLIPFVRGIMGLVSWQPPKDTGSAGKVETYHVFYGVVDLGSQQMIKQFEGTPEHRVIPGNICSVDIFLNITTLGSYKTIGVMVRAAGPGQIVETPFGNIIYADNRDSMLHTKSGNLISDDETVIVISSSDREWDHKGEHGIGVEIFWRRPDEDARLDVFQYALEWGRLHSNRTSIFDDDDSYDQGTSAFSHITTNGILPLRGPIDPEDVRTLEAWNNLSWHIFNTSLLEDDGNTVWIVLVIALTTAVTMCLLGALAYKRWHQRRVKIGFQCDSSEQRYRHYSEYGPGQSLEGAASDRKAGHRRVVDKWELPVSSVKTGSVLGSGAFGKVVKGRVSRAVLEHRDMVTSLVQGGELCLDQADNYHVTVAIKMLHDHCEFQHKQDFLKEIDLMKRIGHHRHVVSMLGCCTGTDPIYLVVEHMANGDLLDYLKGIRQRLAGTNSIPGHYRNATQGLHSATDLLNFARQIALGMEFLASKGYVHRDLAARNVLVDSSHQCKIGDFGLTRYMYDDQVYVNRKGGRLPVKWMSIEAIFDQSFSTASDVWSFGIVLFEISTLGGTPYPTISSKDLLKELQAGYRMDRPQNCSHELYQMMMQCWQHDPRLRPSFRTLSDRLQHLLSDQSGVDYIDMGININRDVYQVDENPEADCTRYPLHVTTVRRKAAVLTAGGVPMVVFSVGTSDDSGYTASKKSSVSSGESGALTPSLNGRHHLEGRGLAPNIVGKSIINDVACGRIASSDGGVSGGGGGDDSGGGGGDGDGGGGDGGSETKRSETTHEPESQHKPKGVRKRVSFIDINEFIEDDDVFQEDVSGNATVMSLDKRSVAPERGSRRKIDGNSTNCCHAGSSHGGSETPFSANTTMSRFYSETNLSHYEKKTKICFGQSQNSKTRISRNFSESDLSRFCNNDGCVTEVLNRLYFEKSQHTAKQKTRKRKMAVVTAPTLALSNDLYFHLDTSRFKQRPPAVKMRRKVKPIRVTPHSPDTEETNNNRGEWSGFSDLKIGRHFTHRKDKLGGFELSFKADVHSQVSREQLETTSPTASDSSVNSQKKDVMRSSPKNGLGFWKDKTSSSDTYCDQTLFLHNGDDNNEDGVSTSHRVEYIDESVSMFDKNKCFEDVLHKDLSSLFHTTTQRDTDNSTDILNFVEGKDDNEDLQNLSPRGTFLLGGLSRIRNDSGIPRSPDDISCSPYSDSRFFPDGSEIEETVKVKEVSFGPDRLALHNNGTSESSCLEDHQIQSTTQCGGGGCYGLEERIIGNNQSHECPVLISEKHPNAFRYTKKRKDMNVLT